ncbi:MAG: hypothetical protein QOJ32_459 [Frankiaceae bacterium]|nr:hypothetical protein [Frankiaceae bacterium]
MLIGPSYLDEGRVFAMPDGRPTHPGRFTRIFDRRGEAAGLPRIRLHDLRHTWATLALPAGINPKVVQEHIGHASVAITLDLYTHVDRETHARRPRPSAGCSWTPWCPVDDECRGRGNGWWRPVAIPEDLTRLKGPTTGRINLPIHVYSSGHGTARFFDLDNDAELMELYENVRRDGDEESVIEFLDYDTLRRLWPRLYLPAYVREAWVGRIG